MADRDPLLAELQALGDQPTGNDPAAEYENLMRGHRAQPAESNVGQSETARQLDSEGYFNELGRQFFEDRQQRTRNAVEQSAIGGIIDQITSTATDTQEYREAAKGFLPGAIDIGGTALQGLSALNPGEATATVFDRYRSDIERVPDMTDAEVAELRQRIAREHGGPKGSVAFVPLIDAIEGMRSGEFTRETLGQQYPRATPVQDRTFYQAGDVVHSFARDLFPAAPGYEQSVGRQIGQGLGSMAGGLLTSAVGGPALAGALFTAAGTGEAVQRAVAFDKAAREAGRPGLTQEQILMAGVMGAAPGATDLAPVEILLGRLKIPGMTPTVANTVAKAVTAVGGRVFFQAAIEGGQEAFQQILQNIIEWKVYNPDQELTAGVLGNFGIGSAVGGITQTGQEALRVGLGRRAPSTRPQPQAGQQLQPAPRADPQAAEPPLTPVPAPESLPFGLERFLPPPQVAQDGQIAVPAPQALPQATARPESNTAVSDYVGQLGDALRQLDTPTVAPTSDVSGRSETQPGSVRRIVTPDGSMEVDATVEIVDLATLRPATGELQPRDRSRAESEVAIREIAANLDPDQLMPGRVSDSGAPVITGDGMVLSGNGRVAAISQAYNDPALAAQAAAYKAALGPAAAGMQQPVLVARLPQAMAPEELRRFADLSNRGRIASMSATERGMRDASAAGPEIMGQYQGGEFNSPANREFSRAFTQSVVSTAERGAFSRDGELTQEGQTRLRAAVLASAYGDPDLLSRLLESTDDNVRGLTGALQDAAGAFIRLKEAIRVGEADAQFDIAPQVVDAVRRIADMRTRGIRPDQALAQQDVFTQIDPISEALIRSFYNDNLVRPLSRQKLAEFLNGYATEAAKHTAEGLIPDQTAPADIIASTRERVTRADAIAEQFGRLQPGLDFRGPGPGSSDAATGGREAPRPEDNRGRAAAGSERNPASEQRTDLDRRFAQLLAGKTVRSQWAKAMGLSEAQLRPLIDRAHTAGLIRFNRDGIARRTVKAKQQLSEIEQYVLHDHRGRQAARTALKMGRTVVVDEDAYNAVLEATADSMRMVPQHMDVGVLTKLEPIGKATRSKSGLLVRAYYKQHDGLTFTLTHNLSLSGKPDFLEARGLYIADQEAIVFLSFGFAGSSFQFVEALRGKVGHEVIHALRNDGFLTAGDWGTLASVSHRLGLLNLTWREWGKLINDPDWPDMSRNSTPRNTYELAYGDNPYDVFLEYMDQETVAFTFDAFLHGVLSAEELGPAYEIFQRIAAGEFGREEITNVESVGAIDRLAAESDREIAELESARRMFELQEALERARRATRLGQRSGLDEAMAERMKLGTKNLNALVAAAVEESGEDAVADTLEDALADIDASAASELERLDDPASTAEQVLDALDKLRELRALRAGPDQQLFAISNWTKEEAFELRESEQAEGERKARRKEYVGAKPTKGLTPEPPNAADRFMREVREYERQLVNDGRSASEISAALRERYGIEVNAREIANGIVWWRVDELLKDPGKGRIRWTLKSDNELREAWNSGISLTKARDFLADVLERPSLSLHGVALRVVQLGLHLRGRRIWNDEMDAVLLSPEVRNLKAKDAVKALKERFPQHEFNEDQIGHHRRRHGLYERLRYSDAAEAFITSAAARTMGGEALAQELSRLERRIVKPVDAIQLRARLKKQGADVGTRDDRNKFWTPGKFEQAISFLQSDEGRRLAGFKQRAEALSRVLSEPIAEKDVDSLSHMARARGTPLPSHTGDKWWKPEEIEAFDRAVVEGLSYKAIANLLREQFGRDTKPGALAQMAARRRKAADQAELTAEPQMLAAFSGRGDEPVRGLREIITDLKSALNMTVTQGRYGLTVSDPNTGKARRFFPAVRGQYFRGVARIPISTDIDAIAHEGGRHLERLFGAKLGTFKSDHAEALAVAPAPDVPVPPMNQSGFSGLELDADTQKTLVDAAAGMREWRRMMADRKSRNRDEAAFHDLSARIAIAAGTLERRLGRRIAAALLGDILGDINVSALGVGLPAPSPYRVPARLDAMGRSEVDPSRVADYVRERYTLPGTNPKPRAPITASQKQLSDGFAEFFRRYIIDPDGIKRDMSEVYVAFGDWLENTDPGLLEKIDLLQLAVVSAEYKRYREATTLARGRADLVSEADKRLTRRVARWLKSIGTLDTLEGAASVVYQAGVDENHSHYLLVQKLLEQADINKVTDAEGRAISLAVHENPYKLIRSLPDAFKTGLRWLQDGMPEYRKGRVFEVRRTSDAAVLDRFPTMAMAQRFTSTVGEPTTIVTAQGHRSKSINEALSIAMGRRWSYDAYVDFGVYLESRRAVEEWKRWEAQGSKPQPDGKGLQREPHRIPRIEHEARIAQLEAIPAYARFPVAAQAVYDFLWQAAIHDFHAGRLSQAELDYRHERRSWYVPFARDVTDQFELGARGTRAAMRRFMKDRPFRGSQRDVLNPIETIIDQSFHRAAATAFQEVMLAYANLADRAGPGASEIAERVTSQELVGANELFNRLEKELIDLGYQPDDAREVLKRVEGDFGDTQLLLQWGPQGYGAVRPLLVPLWINGERQFLRINDPEWAGLVYQSLNGVGRELSNLFVDFVATPAAVLRSTVVTSPAFVLPNIIRDSWSAWVLTGALPGITQARGLYHELFQTDMSRLYSEVGGLMGGQSVAALSKVRDKADVMALRDKGLQMKPIKLGLSAAVGGGLGFMAAGPIGAGFGALLGAALHRGRPVEDIAHFADLSETATRKGVFVRAYKMALEYNPSLTPYQAAQEAAFVARDLIDFGRHGSKMLAVARTVAFLNANVQGVDKAVRTLLARSDRGQAISTTKLTALIAAGAATGLVAGPIVGAAVALGAPAIATNLAARSAAIRALLAPFTKKDFGIPLSRDEEKALGTSAKTFARLFLLTLGFVGIAALYHDDDDYKAISDRLKHRNQPVKIGGEWLMFPKPFEWAVPSNILEAAIDAQFGQDPRFWKRVREGLFDVLVPPGVPQSALLWSDIRSNHNSRTGRPLVPEYLQNDPPELQFTAYSSGIALWLSRAVNERPALRGAVETAGGAMFATKKFELTPAMIDYVLRTGLAYFGQDIQRTSDLGHISGQRVSDYPLLGTAARRFIVDPNRTNDAIDAYWDLMGREHDGYRRAANGYKRYAESHGGATANAWLAALESPEQQAYALLETSASMGERRRHPFNRLRDIMQITLDMEREMRLQRLADTTSKTDPQPIRITPAQRDELADALSRIRAVEANNAMVVLQHRQFASRRILSADPALEVLRSISPAAATEYELRLRRKHVVDFADVRNWPAERNQLIEGWREQMDREAAEVNFRSGRAPKRLPIGSSAPDPAMVPTPTPSPFQLPYSGQP